MKRPFAEIGTKPTTFCTKAAPVTPDNNTDIPTKFVEVTSIAGGNILQILPWDNADGDWITYTGVQVGFVPKITVRRVGTATTCGVMAALN